ncbi:MAG: glycosyltransferase [Ignavibacteriae bacterium]|nr:glycosyltransferase [Ignavibacteriota bacterium]
MVVLEIIFWLSLFTIFYSYAGYGILIIILSKVPILIKLLPKPSNRVKSEMLGSEGEDYYPDVSMIISASGENRDIIRQKIRNTAELEYPREKLEVIFAIAYDKNSESDETLTEYYDNFLSSFNPPDVTSKDEEAYVKFSRFEESGHRDFSVLHEMETELNNSEISTEDISHGAKYKLDEHFGAEELEELTVRVTKDIERKGKIAQVNRTVLTARGDIIVFSDANSMFNKSALINITRHFRDTRVGCVAGEKRVKQSENSTSGEGEGLYWKYESVLKKIDSEIWTTIGAAGEIFSVRKELWNNVIEDDAIIEDFLVSMRIAGLGYRVIYEPGAYAEEEPTFNLSEEFKRRRRIAAGGFQSMVRLMYLLNIFKYRVLTFQYVSHRVLRWAVVPFLLPVCLALNVLILMINFNVVYLILLMSQFLFYFLAFAGYMMELKGKKIKAFYFPFLLTMMNWAAYVGLKRYLRNEQKVVWERAKR